MSDGNGAMPPEARAWLESVVGQPVAGGRLRDLEVLLRDFMEDRPVVSPVDGRGLSLGGASEVQTLIQRMRVQDAARELHAADMHAIAWKAPLDHGNLTAELELPDNAPEWRIDGLLGLGHNAIAVAGRKAGKTTMINNLIRSYVDGVPFLGHFEVTPADAAVAVFNYEVDDRQYRRWLRKAGIGNTDRVFHLPLRGQSLPLKNPRVRAWVTKWLAERGVGLWIVDPYSRAHVGSVDNGNDEVAVGGFLDTLDVIKAEAGVSELVMPVHTPKARAEAGEETAIGSQRLEGWPDALWYLTREVVTNQRFLRAEGRDVQVDESPLLFDKATGALTFDNFGGNRQQAKAEHQGNVDRAAILRVLREVGGEGVSQNDLHVRTNISHQRIKAAAPGMISAGEIHVVAGPNRSRIYRLGPAPAQESTEAA